jgi:DNA invertase Pin-like site-specific DNA recombinase
MHEYRQTAKAQTPRCASSGTHAARKCSLLGSFAELERELIRTRTAEGRSRAKAHGRHMDRPPKLTAQQQAEARRRRAEGATLTEFAKSYHVRRATISRLAG